MESRQEDSKQVCTFSEVTDSAGRLDDYSGYKVVETPRGCKEYCRKFGWCVAAQFDFNNYECFLYQGDTLISPKKGSVFMVQQCTEVTTTQPTTTTTTTTTRTTTATSSSTTAVPTSTYVSSFYSTLTTVDPYTARATPIEPSLTDDRPTTWPPLTKFMFLKVTTTSPATAPIAPESRTRMSTSTESTTLMQRMSKKVRPSSQKKKGRKPVSLMVNMLHRKNYMGDQITPTEAFTTTAAPTTPAPTTPIATSSSTKTLQASTTSRPGKRSRKGQSSRKPKRSESVEKRTQSLKTVIKKTSVRISISYKIRKGPQLSKLTKTRKSTNIASTTAVPFIDLNNDSSSTEIRLKVENDTERKQKSTYRMPKIRIRSKVSVNPTTRYMVGVLHSGMTSVRNGCIYRCPPMVQWYIRYGQFVPFTRRTYFQPLYRSRITVRLRIPAFQ
ncbi:uncharacterized protein [Haliotis asinina]|uniref:uncharacterized protein n=1 Tax=Haliotis asinina TaxID=109174 RepID=UPI0035319FB5